jgi:UDP-2,3-diacylglucosamine pyrophosphatase LpxH
MATTSQGIGLGTLPLPHRRIIRNVRRGLAYRRLSQASKSARVVPFDDASRFVFFSDCHRGDNSRTDSFVRNKELFLHALTHYYQEGFTYIEVGDGDELWKNRKFGKVRRAHKCVFDLLHMFDRQNRLHLILGNHDIQGFRCRQVEKDGIIAEEALVLQHTRSGQHLFVVHRHQADLESNQLYIIGRLLVRYVWKRLQLLGLVQTASQEGSTTRRARIEQRIIEWVEDQRLITICGHTHNPTCTRFGAVHYFNAGSCIFPGYITGLELQDGRITLVKWVAYSARGQAKALRAERQISASPTELYLPG